MTKSIVGFIFKQFDASARILGQKQPAAIPAKARRI